MAATGVALRLGFTVCRGEQRSRAEESAQSGDWEGGKSNGFGTGFGFPRPCLRGVTLARRNVDWTDVLSVREICAFIDAKNIQGCLVTQIRMFKCQLFVLVILPVELSLKYGVFSHVLKPD
jgi:hypothetical protein